MNRHYTRILHELAATVPGVEEEFLRQVQSEDESTPQSSILADIIVGLLARGADDQVAPFFAALEAAQARPLSEADSFALDEGLMESLAMTARDRGLLKEAIEQHLGPETLQSWQQAVDYVGYW